MATYLVFPSMTAAQARSAQQATDRGCTDDTRYWWAQIAGPNGQAALVIDDAGDYGPSGLTAAEQSALQTVTQLTAAGWTLP